MKICLKLKIQKTFFKNIIINQNLIMTLWKVFYKLIVMLKYI